MAEVIHCLTEEELADLGVFDFMVFNLVRDRAQKEGTVPAAWLSTNGNAKARSRREFVEWYNAKTPGSRVLDENAVRQHLEDQFNFGGMQRLKPQVAFWQQAEAQLKQARAEGNPRAYFIG